MHWKRILAIIAPLILILSACAPKVQVPDSAAILETLSKILAVEPRSAPLTDDLGRSIDIASIPNRIISLAPSNTEILFALGLGSNVVGVTNYCNYPQEVNDRCDLPEESEGKITRVGAPFPGFSIETIASLEPDLVLGFGYTLPEYVPQLEGLGLTVVILGPEDIEGILADILFIGKVTGMDETAIALTNEMKVGIANVLVKTARANDCPTVFYEIDGTDPTKPWTAGPGSFVSALISLAGGENIGAGGPTQGFQISTEQILSVNPEIVILADVGWGVTPESVAARTGWDQISAVVNGKIYPIDPDLTSRPGPRIIQGLLEMARIIHPELEL